MKMSEKLKDYQVVDVLCGGAFYKVKHKVTSTEFAWKPCDCSAYSREQVQTIINEVKTITSLTSGNLLRYHHTVLHDATRTLYFVLEYDSWRSLRELLHVCRATDKYFSETFIWHLLLELAKTCKLVEKCNLLIIRKCITTSCIYIGGDGRVCVDCFQLQLTSPEPTDLLQQAGQVIHSLCHQQLTSEDKIGEFRYSDDLRDVVLFVADDRSPGLRPEFIMYHPTVLSNIEGKPQPKHLSDILVPNDYQVKKSELNKCDSEKVVEMCKSIKPLPRRQMNIMDSPIYANVSPKQKPVKKMENFNKPRGSLSPTLAALALELPGYVPRCRRPYSEALETYNSAQRVSEETMSDQWMSRLIALRKREMSLNKRERDLVVKEIINSPTTKFVFQENTDICKSNGITLPPVVVSVEKKRRMTRRRRSRSRPGGMKNNRQSHSYEDLDSSLSEDTDNGSINVTSTKLTLENMPLRNISPVMSTKTLHFKPNPFVGSDESISLTFCELDNIDSEQRVSVHEKVKDIKKFKYLNSGNSEEGRKTKLWSHSSPCTHSKVFTDITNQHALKKASSKSSLTSRCSMMSSRSQWSTESSISKVSESYVSDRTRSSIRQFPQTPSEPSNLKQTKGRKSLLNFKTPFKFKSSSKV